MRRREFIALMGASVTRPFAALAQQAGRTYRLGCLLPLGIIASSGGSLLVTASANGRYLVQNGKPWLMVGDAAQGMMRLIPGDVTTYLTTRQSQGFNAIQFDLVAGNYANIGNANMATNDGLPPFGTGTDIITAGQGASLPYWARMDSYVSQCAALGLVAILNPIEQSAAGPDFALLSNAGPSGCTTYWTFVGNRYKNFPNVIWQLGNDFDDTTSTTHSCTLALVNAVAAADPGHLLSIEFNTGSTSLSSIYGQGVYSGMSVNGYYAYTANYGWAMVAYNSPSTNFAGAAGTNKSPTPCPTFLVEGVYAAEHQGTLIGTRVNLRRQSYWNLTCGSSGQIYGCGPVEFFTGTNDNGETWQQAIANTNANGVGDLQVWKAFVATLPWQNLIPDQTHVIGTNPGTPGMADAYASDYVCVAATADKTTAVAYLGNGGSITIDLSQFPGQVTARWFDPVSAGYTTAAGSPFNNSGTHAFAPSGNNSAGDPDWMLLLQA
jgi:Protein of unknown function (DUF4038)/Putative collagen-binding domain of a collagenase